MEKKKFNEEIYNGIKEKGVYEDNYYKYIIIDKKLVFKGWKSSYLSGQKYEFFGILDKTKKDIFTINNIEELQKDFNEIARKQVLNGIVNQYDFYVNLQKDNFNKKLENKEFKESILYYYKDGYSSNNFNELFIKNIKIEDFKKELISKVVNVNKIINNEEFINKYLTESKENIISEIKEKVFSAEYINEWDFNYNWNNERYGEKEFKIDFSFNNHVSLYLNKVELIINEYSKIYNNPSILLKKCKKMYNLCSEFKKVHDNKTCYLYLKNGEKLKVLNFDYLIDILERGEEKVIVYRLFTGTELKKLEKYNEETKNLTREDDLFIEDIQKLEFNGKIIY